MTVRTAEVPLQEPSVAIVAASVRQLPAFGKQIGRFLATARIEGDISYQLLEMHPGAVVEGELRPLKMSDKTPALTLAASNDA